MTIKNGASYRDRPPHERTEASKKFERDLDATLASIDAGRTCEMCRYSKYETHTGDMHLVCWHPRRNGCGRRVDDWHTCRRWTEQGTSYEPRGRRYGQ